MIARAFAPAALIAVMAAPAAAATHSYAFGSFDRVRVEGPFAVTVSAGGSPGATAEGDPRALDRIDLVMQGTTLVVRAGSEGWGETPETGNSAPATVTLSTPQLRGVSVNGGGRVTVTAIRAQRVDLSVTGAGTLAASGVDADELYASLLGTGTLTLAGKALRARLVTNGSGVIDAAALPANDLVVLQDGTGETRAAARYTAQIASHGLGGVSVTGTPKCTIQKGAVGPVSCGAGPSDAGTSD